MESERCPLASAHRPPEKLEPEADSLARLTLRSSRFALRFRQVLLRQASPPPHSAPHRQAMAAHWGRSSPADSPQREARGSSSLGEAGCSRLPRLWHWLLCSFWLRHHSHCHSPPRFCRSHHCRSRLLHWSRSFPRTCSAGPAWQWVKPQPQRGRRSNRLHHFRNGSNQCRSCSHSAKADPPQRGRKLVGSPGQTNDGEPWPRSQCHSRLAQ